jgi:hypothetical protein
MATTTMTARTSYGSLRGVADDDVVIFEGSHTAGHRSDTSDSRRLSPPDGWTGTRDSTIFGPRALQPAVAASPRPEHRRGEVRGLLDPQRLDPCGRQCSPPGHGLLARRSVPHGRWFNVSQSSTVLDGRAVSSACTDRGSDHVRKPRSFWVVARFGTSCKGPGASLLRTCQVCDPIQSNPQRCRRLRRLCRHRRYPALAT